MTAECPVCGGEVPFAKDAVAGELIDCPECGTELEITSVNPPEVQEAPTAQEDWGE